MRKFIRCMYGIGDALYTRPFLKYFAKKHSIYLDTALPEVFEDLPIKTVKPARMPLRTQGKNVEKAKYHMQEAPNMPKQHIHYGPNLQTSNIIDIIKSGFEACFDEKMPTEEIKMELDFIKPIKESTKRPIAVVKPVTERKEWHNKARSPIPEYIETISEKLMEKYYVISLADLKEGEEWLCQKRTYANKRYHKGEVSILEMISICAGADLVVGGVGNTVPIAMSCGKKALVVCGGHGGYNHPERINNPYQDCSNLTYMIPDNYHCCTDMQCTKCDKIISDFEIKLNLFLEGL